MDNQKSTKQSSTSNKVSTVAVDNEATDALKKLIGDLGLGSANKLWQAADVMSNKNRWNDRFNGNSAIFKKDFDNLIWGLRTKSNITLTKEQVDYLYGSIKVSPYDYSVIEKPVPEEYFARKARATKANGKKPEASEAATGGSETSSATFIEEDTTPNSVVSSKPTLADEKQQAHENPSSSPTQPEESIVAMTNLATATTNVPIAIQEAAKTKPSLTKRKRKATARHGASKTVLTLIAVFFIIFLIIVTIAITTAITSDVPFGPAPGDLEVQNASLQILPVNPKVGENVATSYTVKNVGGQEIIIDRIIVGVSYGSCDGDWQKRKNEPGYGFAATMNIPLNPGGTYTYSMTRSFPLPGVYFAEPEVEIGGHWGGIKNFISKCFTVTHN